MHQAFWNIITCQTKDVHIKLLTALCFRILALYSSALNILCIWTTNLNTQAWQSCFHTIIASHPTSEVWPGGYCALSVISFHRSPWRGCNACSNWESLRLRFRWDLVPGNVRMRNPDRGICIANTATEVWSRDCLWMTSERFEDKCVPCLQWPYAGGQKVLVTLCCWTFILMQDSSCALCCLGLCHVT